MLCSSGASAKQQGAVYRSVDAKNSTNRAGHGGEAGPPQRSFGSRGLVSPTGIQE